MYIYSLCVALLMRKMDIGQSIADHVAVAIDEARQKAYLRLKRGRLFVGACVQLLLAAALQNLTHLGITRRLGFVAAAVLFLGNATFDVRRSYALALFDRLLFFFGKRCLLALLGQSSTLVYETNVRRDAVAHQLVARLFRLDQLCKTNMPCELMTFAQPTSNGSKNLFRSDTFEHVFELKDALGERAAPLVGQDALDTGQAEEHTALERLLALELLATLERVELLHAAIASIGLGQVVDDEQATVGQIERRDLVGAHMSAEQLLGADEEEATRARSGLGTGAHQQAFALANARALLDAADAGPLGQSGLAARAILLHEPIEGAYLVELGRHFL